MIKQYKSVNIKRSQINIAGYNPREITPEAKRRLKKNLETMGLMGGIVWNKTTSNLVSGHQRIAILDKAYSYPTNDYDIEVVEVELSLKEEKIQNIALNNLNLQGHYEEGGLKVVLEEINFDETTGFLKTEIMSFFGTAEMLSDEEYEKHYKAVAELTNTFKNMSTEYLNSDDFYMVVVFKNPADKENIVNHFNLLLAGNVYIAGEHLIEAIKGIDYGTSEQKEV